MPTYYTNDLHNEPWGRIYLICIAKDPLEAYNKFVEYLSKYYPDKYETYLDFCPEDYLEFVRELKNDVIEFSGIE